MRTRIPYLVIITIPGDTLIVNPRLEADSVALCSIQPSVNQTKLLREELHAVGESVDLLVARLIDSLD